MKSFAHSIRVAGIVTAVPAKVVQNHQFVDRFDPKSIADFVQSTYDRAATLREDELRSWDGQDSG